MNAENIIKEKVKESIASLFEVQIEDSALQVQKTREEFEGDYTVVTFPLTKITRKSPEETAKMLGEKLVADSGLVDKYNVIKGFLNLKLSADFWANRLKIAVATPEYGIAQPSGKTVMLEYSSPNTNKPLHLGHIRNNLLGWSVSEILKACGHEVIRANLVNDRGIHICKSMLAWQKFGNGETPQSSTKKGDKLVGDYYVAFDKEYKRQIKELIDKGVDPKEAERTAPLFIEAQEMLRKWEAGDKETVELWRTMNGWVYKGFDQTYAALGISFDKIYYESDTYLLGKKIVEQGLLKGIFFKKDDGSVWVDLTDKGLDQKLLLRGDGTSVYMTQDLGTAEQRFAQYDLDSLIYVVGNEQNYHFQVLKLILAKLGHKWASSIYHLSYGMVELPEGKMKSREGTVVDADDLVAEMVTTARTMSEELGKLDEMTIEEAESTVNMIGLGALKYFILKVDPQKTMLFDPNESIQLNGNTAPFIQYTYARIKSVLRKADPADFKDIVAIPSDSEIKIIKLIEYFPMAVAEAGTSYSPSVIANYVYELAKEYNRYYHDFKILKEPDNNVRTMRLVLSEQTADIIKRAMKLLGITVPEKM